MINLALMQHWQNWLFVGFVAMLVSIVIINAKKVKVKE